jgi:hypothetical protein
MAYEVLLAVVSRLERDGRIPPFPSGSRAATDEYVRAVHERAGVRLERGGVQAVERPPMAQALPAVR